jgi:putative glutamine amidotransferase
LAAGFGVEAVSNEDGLIESIRRLDPAKPYVAAVQWHPEFHQLGSDTIDDAALLADFLAAATAAKQQPKQADEKRAA